MARDLSAKCRKCRRAGEKLFLKGDRCSSPKCGVVRKNYAPGMHGKKMSKGFSEYGKQLAMKQKIKRIYGVMERQFRMHFGQAQKKQGVTGDMLIVRLEMRLDNIVYRMGFASSRTQARQLVRHGFFLVNGKKVNIPAYEVKIGDIVSSSDVKKEKEYMKSLSVVLKKKKDFPSWILFDGEKLEGKIVSAPEKADTGVNVDAQQVVEFYSR